MAKIAIDVPSANDTAFAQFCLSDEVTQVCEGLYLSGYDTLTDEKITDLQITFIINATIEKPSFDIPNIDVLKLNVLDVPTENMQQHVDSCADKIHEVKSSGGRTLVHCALGISRSVTVCLAYLVKHGKMTLRDAYFELKRKRPRIRPNDGFWRQLIAFEIKVTGGKASVKMLSFPGGSVPDVYSLGNGNRSGSRVFMK